MEESRALDSYMNSIDRLPDELLIVIVSALPVKEAVKTSILARRWRHLWEYATSLDFDDSKMARNMETRRKGTVGCYSWMRYMSKKKMLEFDRTSFIRCVDRVLSLHLSKTIDEFRIAFDLDDSNADDINKWIEFAIKKKVKRLDLSMIRSYEQSLQCRQYAFPNICHGMPRGESTLVSLRLTKVDVSEEVLELILSNCPLLEELHVEDTDSLISMRPSDQLRRLAIVNCQYFGKLEIRSLNLESLECSGVVFDPIIELDDFSSLVHLSLGGVSLWLLFDHFCSTSFLWLETLTIHITTTFYPEDIEGTEIPRLPRLKKLVLEVGEGGRESYLCFVSLLNVAPQLCELTYKMWWPRSNRRHGERPRQEHQCLKVFEIELLGYKGVAVPVVVADWVLGSVSSLENMIINGKILTGKRLHVLKEAVATKMCNYSDVDPLIEFN